MKTFQDFLLEKTLKLNKSNSVTSDNESNIFAQEYVKAMKGDFTSGGGTSADAKASDEFWSKYDSKEIKHGFAGSGITIYTDKETGDQYKVERSANGKGFDGTDHNIRKV